MKKLKKNTRNKKSKVIYPCKICNNLYDSVEQANHCSSLLMKNNNFIIGDSVLYEKKEIVVKKKDKKWESNYYQGEILDINIVLNKNGNYHAPIYKIKYYVPKKDILAEKMDKDVEYYNLIPIYAAYMNGIKNEI